MSAEILREAAALMRSRANAALEPGEPGRWKDAPAMDPENNGWVVSFDVDDDYDTTVAVLPFDYEGYVAPHVASWHPAVALAVAKAMDDVAHAWEICDDGWTRDMDDDPIRFEDTVDGGWLNVARAYLGESA